MEACVVTKMLNSISSHDTARFHWIESFVRLTPALLILVLVIVSLVWKKKSEMNLLGKEDEVYVRLKTIAKQTLQPALQSWFYSELVTLN